jgi:hypothetical protein
MFNPLAIWTEKALEGFVREGKRYFVRQSFDRAKSPFGNVKNAYFLFCHYQVYTQAREHFDALTGDPFRFLYDWEMENHRKKLLVAASQPAGYEIYSNTFMPDWERHITNRLKQKLRAFIQSHGWKPGREDGVLIDFYPHFGEVMVSLRFREQKLSVKLEEIEKKF